MEVRRKSIYVLYVIEIAFHIRIVSQVNDSPCIRMFVPQINL